VSVDAASQGESEQTARTGDSSQHKADSSRQTADGEAMVRFSQPRPREPSLSWPHDLLLASIEQGGQDRLCTLEYAAYCLCACVHILCLLCVCIEYCVCAVILMHLYRVLKCAYV
jgi:hypothetical protein